MANETARKLRKSMTRQESKLWRHLREVRVWNADVEKNVEGVFDQILLALRRE